MNTQAFSPGCRLSAFDGGILAVGGLAAACISLADPRLGIAIVFVVMHFFLFCNVLRMSRRLEMVWAGVFLGLAACSILFHWISWPAVFAVSGVVTALVAVVEIRKPSYHGVGWRKFNPRLPEWWRAQTQSSGETDQPRATDGGLSQGGS